MSDKGKRFFSLLLVSVIASTALVGCSSQKTATQSSQTLQDKVNQFVSEVSGAVSDLQESLSAESSADTKPNSGELVESDKTSGDFTYDLYSDHIVVTAYTGKSVKVEVPSEIEGLPVTVVKGKQTSFNSAKAIVDSSVVSVTLPDTLLKIGDYSFYESNVKTVKIPDSVVRIGEQAFYRAGNIEGLKLPSKLKTIEEDAFWYCSPNAFGEKLIIPDGVTVIPSNFFYIINSSQKEDTLKELVIGDNVQSIGHSAFEGNGDLKKITFGNSVSTIGAYAFRYCGLTSITIPEGVTSIERSTFEGCKELTSLTLPKGVESIGKEAFRECGLTSLTLPEGIKLGEGAFADCQLTSLVLPEGVTLSASAFYHNGSLKNVIIQKNTQFDERNSYGVFSFCGLEEVEIHSERVPSNIFGWNEQLKNVILSDEVVSVEDDVFDMKHITGSLSIHISESVEFLDDNFISDLDADKLTIYGKKGSEAEKYAKKNSVKFVEE